MARDDGGAGTVVIAFVLGAVTGAAVALLMAPTTGPSQARLSAVGMMNSKAVAAIELLEKASRKAGRQSA